MSNIKVLYEDNHLIAVEKPVGMLTQGDKSGDVSLMDEVKKYLKEKYKKPGNVFLGLVHRLDRNVSGIVVFAKTSKGASRLSKQFRNGEIEKTYHAVVSGKMKKNKGIMKNFIVKKETKAEVFDSYKNGSKEAELSYEVLNSNDKCSFLKIILKTGKFHQIRAQMAHLGNPIIGDIKYGSKVKTGNIALCATGISFKLATEDKIKKISIPVPKDWNKIIKIV